MIVEFHSEQVEEAPTHCFLDFANSNDEVSSTNVGAPPVWFPLIGSADKREALLSFYPVLLIVKAETGGTIVRRIAVRSMRAAFCLIILLSATVALGGKPQPAATPERVILTPAQARRVSAYTLRPQYPSIGRRIQGSGMFRLYVELQTGLVRSTQIEQSTGYQILDTTAIDTLKRWRFKPDLLRAYADPHNRDTVVVRVPVTFGGRRT